MRTEHLLQLLGRQGASAQEALEIVTAELSQHRELFVGLDPFGDHRKRHGLRQRQHGGDQNPILVLLDQSHDEAAIQFDLVDWQLLQVSQRGVAGAKIIDGEVDPQLADGLHLEHGFVEIFQDHRFGELQHQAGGRDPAVVDDLLQLRQKITMVKLAGTDVDRNGRQFETLALPVDKLGAGLLQHPKTDLIDQAGLLGDRNKLSRGDELSLMFPTQ